MRYRLLGLAGVALWATPSTTWSVSRGLEAERSAKVLHEALSMASWQVLSLAHYW
jgi:hypothetical protein